MKCIAKVNHSHFALVILVCGLVSNVHSQTHCSDAIGEYAKLVTNSRGATIERCAAADKIFSPIYRSNSISGGSHSSLSESQYSDAREYYTSCFHSVEEISIQTDDVFVDLRKGLTQYLYTLVARGNGESVAFCSAVSLGSGFAAPAHCFQNSAHTKGLGKNVDLEYHSTTFEDDGSVKFVPNSFSDWDVFSIDGPNFKPLEASDFYYFLPPDPSAKVNIMNNIEPYTCGQMAYIGGVSSLHLRTLRFFGEKATLRNGILVGGYRSWCLGLENAGKSVVKHLCSSTGGQSGAPILVNSDRGFRPVGMHLGGKMSRYFDPKNESASNYMFIFETLRDQSLSSIGTARDL